MLVLSNTNYKAISRVDVADLHIIHWWALKAMWAQCYHFLAHHFTSPLDVCQMSCLALEFAWERTFFRWEGTYSPFQVQITSEVSTSLAFSASSCCPGACCWCWAALRAASHLTQVPYGLNKLHIKNKAERVFISSTAAGRLSQNFPATGIVNPQVPSLDSWLFHTLYSHAGILSLLVLTTFPPPCCWHPSMLD